VATSQTKVYTTIKWHTTKWYRCLSQATC